jgi:hypothetical protein
MSTATLTVKKSVTIPGDLAIEAEGLSGDRGFSAYVTRALATQVRIDRLTEYINTTAADLGPVPEEVRAQVRADIAIADTKIGYVR